MEDRMVKCHKYWPDSVDPVLDMSADVLIDQLDFPKGLKASYVSCQEFPDYKMTEILLESGDTQKRVLHYYYHSWADSKVPTKPQSLIELSDALSKLKKEYKVTKPIVHCSAGVGRTGTFIALDFLHNHTSYLMKSTSSDVIHDVLKKLRDGRVMMVQTLNQYMFLYAFFKKDLGLDK
ncbi:tyrosine protein phosphatase 1 [Yamadazyma tenuis]|nr:tyrosine protein phosphatase 1 [Yamadazyma tenuis]